MGAILDHLVRERGAEEKRALKALKGWDIRPIVMGNTQIGEIMVLNNEVHFALNPDFRLTMGRVRLLRKVFTELFDEFDFLITKMFRGDRYIELVTWFGFQKIKEDDTFEYFWMNKEDCKCLH